MHESEENDPIGFGYMISCNQQEISPAKSKSKNIPAFHKMKPVFGYEKAEKNSEVVWLDAAVVTTSIDDV